MKSNNPKRKDSRVILIYKKETTTFYKEQQNRKENKLKMKMQEIRITKMFNKNKMKVVNKIRDQQI